MTELGDLGWDDSWAREFETLARGGEVPARVVLEHNHVYRVMSGLPEPQLAELAGRVRYEAAGRHEMPAVGDWVILRPSPATGARPQIRAILPRRSAFSRKAAGRETEEQVVAANIDTVFLVSGLDQDFNPRRVERYLVMARASGARPVVVLNKADLAEDLAADIASIIEIAPDIPVHPIVAKGDSVDVSALRPYLGHGQTVALLGSSGVGKSTIINALAGRDVLKTAEVREQDGRGRHTSVHRQLVALEQGGLVIDTPGMREIQLWAADEPLDLNFPDVDALGAGCRFRDCRHDREPGCAVKAAVEAGALDPARYESFLKLSGERESLADKLEDKRQSRVMGKALKAMQKNRGR
jgi:ribosome biogenesis GTPase